MALGGRPAQATARRLLLPVSKDTLVRTVRRHAQAPGAAPRVIGIDDWAPYVRQDPRFMRPAEVDHLIGDASKAREVLGWKPKVSFRELVAMMVDADLAATQQGW